MTKKLVSSCALVLLLSQNVVAMDDAPGAATSVDRRALPCWRRPGGIRHAITAATMLLMLGSATALDLSKPTRMSDAREGDDVGSVATTMADTSATTQQECSWGPVTTFTRAIDLGRDDAALRLMLGGGFNVSEPDDLQRLPLHVAARHERLEIMAELLERGAMFNHETDEGQLALTHTGVAVVKGLPELAEALPAPHEFLSPLNAILEMRVGDLLVFLSDEEMRTDFVERKGSCLRSCAERRPQEVASKYNYTQVIDELRRRVERAEAGEYGDRDPLNVILFPEFIPVLRDKRFIAEMSQKTLRCMLACGSQS